MTEESRASSCAQPAAAETLEATIANVDPTDERPGMRGMEAADRPKVVPRESVESRTFAFFH